MKSLRQLPFVTNHGHEYYISWDKATATIFCNAENEAECFTNPIPSSCFDEMVLTAATAGIKVVNLSINYSMEIHSKQMKDLEQKYNIKINRLTKEE